jgi:hypothetical protein
MTPLLDIELQSSSPTAPLLQTLQEMDTIGVSVLVEPPIVQMPQASNPVWTTCLRCSGTGTLLEPPPPRVPGARRFACCRRRVRPRSVPQQSMTSVSPLTCSGFERDPILSGHYSALGGTDSAPPALVSTSAGGMQPLSPTCGEVRAADLMSYPRCGAKTASSPELRSLTRSMCCRRRTDVNEALPDTQLVVPSPGGAGLQHEAGSVIQSPSCDLFYDSATGASPTLSSLNVPCRTDANVSPERSVGLVSKLLCCRRRDDPGNSSASLPDVSSMGGTFTPAPAYEYFTHPTSTYECFTHPTSILQAWSSSGFKSPPGGSAARCETMELVCQACGNVFAPDSIFCRKSGNKRARRE